LIILYSEVYSKYETNKLADSYSKSAVLFNYQQAVQLKVSNGTSLNLPSESELRMKWVKEKVERMSRKMRKPVYDKLSEVGSIDKPNYKAHIFYYAWYGTPQVDGDWKHWNHEFLPNWRKDEFKTFGGDSHKPPDDIGSNFYPQLGCYSSRNISVIEIHMKEIRQTGIGKLLYFLL
jgi:hypothetical protein